MLPMKAIDMKQRLCISRSGCSVPLEPEDLGVDVEFVGDREPPGAVAVVLENDQREVVGGGLPASVVLDRGDEARTYR